MRRVLAPALLALLAGCGFQPLYGNGPGGDVSTRLQDIYVATIPNRTGQNLRLALQESLGGASQAEPRGYTLKVVPGFAGQAIDIHPDNTSGRVRELGSAHWSLYTVEATPRLVAQGEASSLDGYNAQYEQYFAQTLNEETVQARLAKTLADTITQQLAIWFRTNTPPPNGTTTDRARYFEPNAMPGANGQPYQTTGPDGFPAAATGRDAGSPVQASTGAGGASSPGAADDSD